MHFYYVPHWETISKQSMNNKEKFSGKKKKERKIQ